MTTKNYSSPPGTCTFPGCTNTRHVSKYGRVYPRCTKHIRLTYRKTATQKGAELPKASRQKAMPVPDTVRVMVLDWESQRLFHVVGVVKSTKAFPRTEGEMKKVIAKAAQQGIHIAYIRAYKEEDLHEST